MDKQMNYSVSYQYSASQHFKSIKSSTMNAVTQLAVLKFLLGIFHSSHLNTTCKSEVIATFTQKNCADIQ